MTGLLLAVIALVAAMTLVGVLVSLARTVRTETANATLRREGIPATGTVVDNTMTSTPQRRLTFSPVVEFRTGSGAAIVAAAQQSAASSWARGSSVDVRYDPAEPARFVLAGAPARSQLVANVIVGLLVAAIMAGTVVGMYHVWGRFRYDRDASSPAGDSVGGP